MSGVGNAARMLSTAVRMVTKQQGRQAGSFVAKRLTNSQVVPETNNPSATGGATGIGGSGSGSSSKGLISRALGAYQAKQQ